MCIVYYNKGSTNQHQLVFVYFLIFPYFLHVFVHIVKTDGLDLY